MIQFKGKSIKNSGVAHVVNVTMPPGMKFLNVIQFKGTVPFCMGSEYNISVIDDRTSIFRPDITK